MPIKAVGKAQLLGETYGHAALGRGIVLGQDDAIDMERLGEDFGLLEPVLPRRRVYDEKASVVGSCGPRSHDLIYLREFFRRGRTSYACAPRYRL